MKIRFAFATIVMMLTTTSPAFALRAYAEISMDKWFSCYVAKNRVTDFARKDCIDRDKTLGETSYSYCYPNQSVSRYNDSSPGNNTIVTVYTVRNRVDLTYNCR